MDYCSHGASWWDEVKAFGLLEAWAWVIKVCAFGGAILVHEGDLVGFGDMCIK